MANNRYQTESTQKTSNLGKKCVQFLAVQTIINEVSCKKVNWDRDLDLWTVEPNRNPTRHQNLLDCFAAIFHPLTIP